MAADRYKRYHPVTGGLYLNRVEPDEFIKTNGHGGETGEVRFEITTDLFDQPRENPFAALAVAKGSRCPGCCQGSHRPWL